MGSDDKHIAPSDLTGMALTSARALSEEKQNLRQEVETLEAQIAAIRAQLSKSVD